MQSYVENDHVPGSLRDRDDPDPNVEIVGTPLRMSEGTGPFYWTTMRPTSVRLLNILVPVKRYVHHEIQLRFISHTITRRAVDYAVKIRVNPQQTGIDLNVKHSMVRVKFYFWYPGIWRHIPEPLWWNRYAYPYLWIPIAYSPTLALEEAVRLREHLKGAVKSIKAVTIGPPKSLETLRTALAMGADSAIHVEVPETAPAPEPLAVAKALQEIIKQQKDGVDLVILGKQAIDDDLGMTGQMLAGLLGWGQATFASKVSIDLEKKEAVILREIDGGGEEIRCRLPLIITTDLRWVTTHFPLKPEINRPQLTQSL